MAGNFTHVLQAYFPAIAIINRIIASVPVTQVWRISVIDIYIYTYIYIYIYIYIYNKTLNFNRTTKQSTTISSAYRVYPKKYAHGFCFAVRCCGCTLTDFPIFIRLTSLALRQSDDCPSASKATLMNMDKYFMWIHYERLHNHNKAKHKKTVCIFLGIYCMMKYIIRADSRFTPSPWETALLCNDVSDRLGASLASAPYYVLFQRFNWCC